MLKAGKVTPRLRNIVKGVQPDQSTGCMMADFGATGLYVYIYKEYTGCVGTK